VLHIKKEDEDNKSNDLMKNSVIYTPQKECGATSKSVYAHTNKNSFVVPDTLNNGSASWSAGCSNEHVHTDVNKSTTMGWSTSLHKIGKSLANIQQPYRVISVKKRRGKPYFILKLFIDSTDNYDLYKKYVAAVKLQNDIVDAYKNSDKQETYFDAGFDLFCPDIMVIGDSRTGAAVHKLNHMVKCSMMKVDYDSNGDKFVHPVGYYMYPRSSTGTKTPLRLANSVGIIDSGYRGHIIAAFDAPPPFSCSGGAYKVEKFQRLVQICPPDLSYPLEVELVADESLLGCGGQRGAGGFGSTGV